MAWHKDTDQTAALPGGVRSDKGAVCVQHCLLFFIDLQLSWFVWVFFFGWLVHFLRVKCLQIKKHSFAKPVALALLPHCPCRV